jgi:hypothetical protein
VDPGARNPEELVLTLTDDQIAGPDVTGAAREYFERYMRHVERRKLGISHVRYDADGYLHEVSFAHDSRSIDAGWMVAQSRAAHPRS